MRPLFRFVSFRCILPTAQVTTQNQTYLHGQCHRCNISPVPCNTHISAAHVKLHTVKPVNCLLLTAHCTLQLSVQSICDLFWSPRPSSDWPDLALHCTHCNVPHYTALTAMCHIALHSALQYVTVYCSVPHRTVLYTAMCNSAL